MAWLTRDGQRVTAWMAYCIDRLSADMNSLFGVHVKIRSAIRTYEEQKAIFLERYVRAGDVRGRRVYDTRWWNGALWYRISSAGTVAQPGTSNHEVQGSKAAVDLYDTGSDAGITVAGSKRANWLRANAHRYGLVPSGYGFNEAWHYDIPNIWNAPPAAPTGGGSKKAMEVKMHYFRDDAKALRKGGLPLKPGTHSYLHTDAKAPVSNAVNVVGGIGEYALFVHVYVEGQEGDQVDVVLEWDQTKTDGPHSPHFAERVTIGKSGLEMANFSFARAVASGFAVYCKVTAVSGNAKNVTVTRLATDALLFA